MPGSCDVKVGSSLSVRIPLKVHTLCQNTGSLQKLDKYEIELFRFGGEENLLEHIIQLAEGYHVKLEKENNECPEESA